MRESRVDAISATHAGVVIRGLRKRFRNLQVLNGVDLEVTPGEVVALTGDNGAGKSTLLRILAGTIKADDGEISIGGHDLNRDPIAARAATSWVLGDEHAWYWRLTGRENLMFFAMLRGAARREAARRAGREVERHGLEEMADRRVAEYSTGMRARLALARASVAQSAAMVLDEPGSGLDATANERLVEMFSDLPHTAVLLVTHDLDLVARAAHRFVMLEAGVVREHGLEGNGADPLAPGIANEDLL